MCDRERYSALDERVKKLESAFAELRGETRTGFVQLTEAVNALGHDFGERMNSMDRRLVEEKSKWGEVLRKIVLWTVGTILTLALAAAGINALPEIVKAFR